MAEEEKNANHSHAKQFTALDHYIKYDYSFVVFNKIIKFIDL